MSAKHTISINGRAYDAVTGLPLATDSHEEAEQEVVVKTSAPTPDVHREPVHFSGNVHQQIHKSQTLRRGHLQAPKSKIQESAPQRHAVGHIARSPMVSHFADHPKPLPKTRTVKMINDIGPVARQAVIAPSTHAQLASREVKERLIAHAGTKVDHALAATPERTKKTKRAPLLKRIRKNHLVAAGIAMLLLSGYVTYLNVPGISVRIAASQAGVDAKYPNFSPDGYSFQGPVEFEQGQVALQFKSNGGGKGYTIIQKNSDWNSVAVLDNFVNKQSGGNYNIVSKGGVTIYTYGTRAAWTNGGVLYEIDGDAPLSSEQRVNIAASL